MTKNRIPLLAFAAVLATPLGANAAALIFDHSGPPDVVVTANDFEFGFTLEGNLFQQGLNSPATASLLESDSPISFSGSWIDLGASGTGSRTIYVVAPGTDDVTDILSYSWSTDGFEGTITGSFSAGTLGDLPGGVNPGDVFPADGSPVPFALGFLGGEIRTPTVTSVPEAVNTGVLTGAVFMGLVALRSLRRRQTA